MVARAQAAGQLRTDVGETDIALIQFMLTGLADFTAHTDPQVWRRHLRIVLDGLTTAAPSALSTPALPRDALDEIARALSHGR